MKLTLLLVCALALFDTGVRAQHPAVPGVERLRQSSTSSPVQRGHVLLQELACTACHAGNGAPAPRLAPDLSRIGGRVTEGWLRDFLLDPQATKPGTTMPDPMPGLDAAARAHNVDLLVHYLASRGGPLAASEIPSNRGQAERGKALYHSIGCVACHAPEEGPARPTDVPFGDLARKTTIDEVERFLLDVHSARPSGRMPNFRLANKEARALAMYLVRAQIDNPQTASIEKFNRPGLLYDYYELSVNRLPDFEAIEPVESGHVADLTIDVKSRLSRNRNDSFGLRFIGELIVPESGRYTLYLSSDDGSRLILDEEQLIDNDGTHGMQEKSAELELLQGSHTLEVQFFERSGGEDLTLHWEGPGIKKGRVPASAFQTRDERPMIPLDNQAFASDAAKAQRGEGLYQSLGCASCHESAAGQATGLAALDATAGCLGEAPANGAVSYALSTEQTGDLRRAITAQSWRKQVGAETAVRRRMAAYNCYACHERHGVGGVVADRDPHFATKMAVDLGDEGRLPPPLTGVGDKLRPAALEAIIARGEHHVRATFMSARMPSFDPVASKALTAEFVAADLTEQQRVDPEFDKEKLDVGRRLVGTTGFACVTCHNVNGNLSPAIQGVDIAQSTARLRPGWFGRYLKNPMAMRPGTRMPGYWLMEQSPFADLLGGSSRKQIEAVWSYLSLGKSMPPPLGVMPPAGAPAMEIVPLEAPIVHRTFMKGVGPRTILCGYPESLHIAFDAQSVRLALAWRGRFFDHSGVASGRTDKFLPPLGQDILNLPAPAFARLEDQETQWPAIPHGARDVGGDFIGYSIGPAGRPTFRYRLGKTTIAERPLPELAAGGAILRRQFEVHTVEPTETLFFLAWRGDGIEPTAAGSWISGGVTVELIGTKDAPIVRQVGGATELLLPIRGSNIRFEEVIRW